MRLHRKSPDLPSHDSWRPICWGRRAPAHYALNCGRTATSLGVRVCWIVVDWLAQCASRKNGGNMPKETPLESAKINPGAGLPRVRSYRMSDETSTPFDGPMIVTGTGVRAKSKKTTEAGAGPKSSEEVAVVVRQTPPSRRIDLDAIRQLTQAGEEWRRPKLQNKSCDGSR